MTSLVPIIAGSVIGLLTYIREDAVTNALLWFIWGAILAVATEVRAARLEQRERGDRGD